VKTRDREWDMVEGLKCSKMRLERVHHKPLNSIKDEPELEFVTVAIVAPKRRVWRRSWRRRSRLSSVN
jgi:hypothetical protein